MYKETLTKDIVRRASKVKLLLMDCDGVLTDGSLYFGNSGEVMKVFNVRDGYGIVEWHRAGFHSGIITGRKSTAVERRANELGIGFLRQGSVDKVADFEAIIAELRIDAEEVAYIGDDLPDIELLKRVGFAIAVFDADMRLDEVIQYKTTKRGGSGAVRECVDLILMTKSPSTLDNIPQI